MRTYGSIQTCFWENPSAQKLSDQAKLLATYLLTGPHTNMIGCFRLPLGYVMIDLNWELPKVKQAIKELSEAKFITRDETFEWVLIHDFLKWNRIQNPKQASTVQKLFDAVPSKATLFESLITNLLTHRKHFPKGLLTYLHQIAQKNGFLVDTVSEPILTEQEQEQDQDQEQKQEQEQEQDQDQHQDQENKIIPSLREGLTQIPKCPHDEIIKLYHHILPMCPPVRIWNKTRQGYLKQRWEENAKHQHVDWWITYFEHVKQSKFLTGKVTGRNDSYPFVADLEWLIRPNNFARTIEGKYHRENAHEE